MQNIFTAAAGANFSRDDDLIRIIGIIGHFGGNILKFHMCTQHTQKSVKNIFHLSFQVTVGHLRSLGGSKLKSNKHNCIPVEGRGSGPRLGISAPQILGFDVAWSHFGVAWPKLWHKNGVFDHILGCSAYPLNPGHPSSLAVVAWRPGLYIVFSALNISKSTQRQNCGIKSSVSDPDPL